jgi:hypothetical protein
MSTTEILDCEAARSDAAETAKAAGKAAAASAVLNRLRRRSQLMSDRAQVMRERAQDLADRAAELTARAQDFASRAPGQARREIARRRSAAAARLESFAEAIRPDEEARSVRNRRTAAIAGGSTVALAAALGLGVALGFYLSRELKKRAEARDAVEGVEPATAAATGRPEGESPLSRASGLPH